MVYITYIFYHFHLYIYELYIYIITFIYRLVINHEYDPTLIIVIIPRILKLACDSESADDIRIIALKILEELSGSGKSAEEIRNANGLKLFIQSIRMHISIYSSQNVLLCVTHILYNFMDILKIPTKEYIENGLIDNILLLLKTRSFLSEVLIKEIITLFHIISKNKELFIHIIKIENPLCIFEV